MTEKDETRMKMNDDRTAKRNTVEKDFDGVGSNSFSLFPFVYLPCQSEGQAI